MHACILLPACLAAVAKLTLEIKAMPILSGKAEVSGAVQSDTALRLLCRTCNRPWGCVCRCQLKLHGSCKLDSLCSSLAAAPALPKDASISSKAWLSDHGPQVT